MSALNQINSLEAQGVKHEHISAALIYEGLLGIARALDRLGTGNAATEMGAIEFLASQVKEGNKEIASALYSIAQATEQTIE